MRNLPLYLCAILAMSCDATPKTEPPSDDSGRPQNSADGGAGTEADSTPCTEQDARLTEGLAKVRTSQQAFLALKNECGLRVLVSGDAKNVNKDALLRIGSVTKTYVSALILKLAEEGKLSLDDSSQQWIPDLPNTTGVTVRTLLNHTSGIFNYLEDPTFLSQPQRVWTPRQIVDFALTHDGYFAATQGFHYSNTNYILLGMIAELAGGEKLGALIRTHTLEPAQLSETFLDGEEAIQGELAPGFDPVGHDLTYALHPSLAWAAGSMVASPADLVRWMEALYAGSILNEASKQLLVQDAIASGSGSGLYGLGVILLPPAVTLGAGPALGHNGGIPGYVTVAFYFPERKLTLVGIVNDDGADANQILVEALTALQL